MSKVSYQLLWLDGNLIIQKVGVDLEGASEEVLRDFEAFLAAEHPTEFETVELWAHDAASW